MPAPAQVSARSAAPDARLAPATAHRLADTFRLLGDSTRLRIVFACLDGPVSVGQIAAGLEQSPSLVSHHLRLLRAARVVESRREGKQVFYWAADEHIRTVLRDMATHVEEPHAREEAG